MFKSTPTILRHAAILAVFLAIAAIAIAQDRNSPPGDIQVAFHQSDDGRLQVIYEFRKPRREIEFGALDAGHRARRWRLESADMKLVRLDEGDLVHRTDGKKFDKLVLSAAPDLIRIPKNYQPLARYGDGGVLIYTGHFWPLTKSGGRENTSFSFTPGAGAKVLAFGERADTLTDWRSPMAHPAFVYMGPLEPVETRDVMAIVDPDAPVWIIEEFYNLTPKAFAHLSDVFGFTLETKPNLFLAAPLGRDEGRLSYAGDALPGQFQITLEGRSWLEPTAKAVDIFRRSTIHEAVHLWQAAARPGDDDVAPWIHEGAADAIAAEALVTLGYWDGDTFTANFEAAKNECAQNLNRGALASAETRQDFRALYACGHVIAEAIARADGKSVSDFWRAFIAEARESDGYTDEDFFDMSAERTGNASFVRDLRLFVTREPADPERAIERLLSMAGAS